MAKPVQPHAVKPSQSSASRTPSQLSAGFARHARKCAICNHPQREEIESEFLHWGDPASIAYSFKLPSRSSVYRHADATGLALQRRLGLRGVAERVLEHVDSANVSGNTILRAMRIFAHITEDGQWLEPPKVSIVEHRHSFANSPSPHALAVTKVEELASPAPPLSPAPAGALLVVYPACPACPEQSRRERGRRDVGRAAPGEKQAGSNGELSSVGQRPKLPSSPHNDQPAPRDSSPLGEILIGTGNASRGEPND